MGLSKSYINKNGSIKKRKKEASWVGSKRYQSPNCHLNKDYGRRDDLWSFLYILIEFYKGRLPWGEQSKEKIYELKIKFMDIALAKKLPHQFIQMLEHIKSLKFSDKPGYRYLFECMRSLFLSEGGDENFLLPWESALAPNPSGFELSYSDNVFPDSESDSSCTISFESDMESNEKHLESNKKRRTRKCNIQ